MDRQIDAETLEIDDDEENEDGGHQVGDVRQVGAVEGFLERANLVRAREEQVEEGDDRAFKLGASARVHRRRRESLPDDAFALVRGDEERNTGTKTVALLQKLIQADDDDARKEELNDDEQRVADSEVTDITIDTAHDVRNGFTDRNQNSQQLLSAIQERSVLLHALIHVDDLGSREQLHHQTRRHNWRDTELHARSSVRRHDDASPIERIRPTRRVDPVQRQLRAHQEDEERHARVQRLFPKRNLSISRLHLGQEAQERAHQVQHAESTRHFRRFPRVCVFPESGSTRHALSSTARVGRQDDDRSIHSIPMETKKLEARFPGEHANLGIFHE